MMQSSPNLLAGAFIEGMDAWKWQLRIDTIGLYRWYLDGKIWTDLRGSTREDAKDRLRRFAVQSLHGELCIRDAA